MPGPALTLNPEQQRAATSTEGPLLVLAGAGSGKTRVLVHRIAHIIERGIAEPWQILAVTFTNKAAGEMRERLEELVGPSIRRAWIGTFHSMCGRMLRMEGHARITTLSDSTEVPALLDREAFGVAFIDITMPGLDGMDVLTVIKDKCPGTECIMVTAYGDSDTAIAGLSAGAEDYVIKQPGYLDSLPGVIENSVKRFAKRLGFRTDIRRLLFLEPDSALFEKTCRYLNRHAPNFRLEHVAAKDDCLNRIRRENFDVLISELRMPDINSIELIKELEKRGIDLPLIVLGDTSDDDLAIQVRVHPILP